jgi:hypothetical protein
MNTFFRLVCLVCLVANALAQTGAELPGPPDPQSERDQRRSDLRNALLTQRQPAQAGEVRRQLSPQEREELRQQLRQQPQGPDKARP